MVLSSITVAYAIYNCVCYAGHRYQDCLFAYTANVANVVDWDSSGYYV